MSPTDLEKEKAIQRMFSGEQLRGDQIVSLFQSLVTALAVKEYLARKLGLFSEEDQPRVQEIGQDEKHGLRLTDTVLYTRLLTFGFQGLYYPIVSKMKMQPTVFFEMLAEMLSAIESHDTAIFNLGIDVLRQAYNGQAHPLIADHVANAETNAAAIAVIAAESMRPDNNDRTLH